MAADGAPTLLSGAAPSAAAPLTADSARSPGATQAEWGIYLNGAQALQPDSIVTVDYERDWSLLDYQVEKGAFETYNKVARPFYFRIRVTKGGSDADRSDFLSKIEAIGESLSLFDVVTPERTYLSVNVSRLGYTRSARDGATLLIIDLGLRQVRVTAVTAFTQVSNPASASPVNGGTVQPASTPAPQQAAVSNSILRMNSSVLSAIKESIQ